MTNEGLEQAIRDLNPVEFTLNGDKIRLRIDAANLSYPIVPMNTVGVRTQRVYPTECRQRAGTYKGRFVARIRWALNGEEQTAFEKDMGEIPIMIKVSFFLISF